MGRSHSSGKPFVGQGKGIAASAKTPSNAGPRGCGQSAPAALAQRARGSARSRGRWIMGIKGAASARVARGNGQCFCGRGEEHALRARQKDTGNLIGGAERSRSWAQPSWAGEFGAREWEETNWQRADLVVRSMKIRSWRARIFPGARLCARRTNRSRLAERGALDSNGCRRGFGAAAAGPRRTQPRSVSCGFAALLIRPRWSRRNSSFASFATPLRSERSLNP